jgi:DNA-binding CsgD family transcriptional regulator
MELIERTEHLKVLNDRYQQLKTGYGHSVFLVGEAGSGKTSLVNQFIKNVRNSVITYIGACDSLFTPRPLGPLYDIADQIGSDFFALLKNEKERALIFTSFFQKLSGAPLPTILVFEDIHWADEATLDLIKFLTRRINRLKCLLLLTYRDNEIHSAHALTFLFGELPPDNFSKLPVKGFSRDVVDQLVAKKGYTSGEKLYALTGGNPFYVMEILASYSPGIPERVKDSILTLFNVRSGNTKKMWEFLSILPTSGIGLNIAKQLENEFGNCIEDCIASGVIVSKAGHLSFKHELFRLAIEESLTASKRKSLHKKMLDLMLQNPSENTELAQLVHHARYSEERELVAKISPRAARAAAAVGSHLEAAKLYSTAIEFTNKDGEVLVELYERHAYECYLTNQITAAITSQQHALEIWRTRKVSLKIGDTLRFLSRLLWYNGTSQEAMSLALEAVSVLENGFPTHERGLAYSNLAQLHMLAANKEKTLYWGQKAIALATKMNDPEVLCHSLNNIGTVLLMYNEPEGEYKLNQSLSIALLNGLHEHVARAYTNLCSQFIWVKSYLKANEIFNAGIKYIEEHDLESWKYFMLSLKVKLLLETGEWSQAETLALSIYQNMLHPNIVRIGAIEVLALINLRRGGFNEARNLISEGKKLAAPTQEAHRIIPMLCAELEFCWITGEPAPTHELTDAENTLFPEKNNSCHYTELLYWKHKCGLLLQNKDPLGNLVGPFKLEIQDDWKSAAEKWNALGCLYKQAIALFYGDEDQQKQSMQILSTLGATATYEMLKAKLKIKGVRNIPRGPRESTRKNPALLTNRQIDVLTLLQEGLHNNEIAERLFVSPKTVEHHISVILSKLEVNSRAKAVLQAQKLGILNRV